MSEEKRGLSALRRDHPVFFWGCTALAALLLVAATVTALRIPAYRAEAAQLDRRMNEAERATRDRVLQSNARRSELAVALLQRELRIKSLKEKGVHIAISVEDSTLALRHGNATLRSVPVRIGPDSTVRGPDGRSWRMIRALGERTIAEKQTSPAVELPEWVYVARGQPVPPEGKRTVEGALGRYVLRLNDGTEIYSEPGQGPFAEGVKPAAFLATERDLRTIFDSVREDTPVFIY